MTDNIKLLKLVNDSGYPFQLYIKEIIKEASSFHGWEVISSEHCWKNHNTGKEGFIDIVLESYDVYQHQYKAVIECKRTQDANWIFITNNRQSYQSQDFSILHGIVDKTRNITIADYLNFFVNPPARESSFCIVRGQEDKTTMLERLCTHLIDSLECLLSQDLSLKQNNINELLSELLFIPIIVTNANLVTCDFNPSMVNPSNGKLELENVKLEAVNYIKFKKTLSSQFKAYPTSTNNQHELAMFNQTFERTVFIVKSTEIINFLRDLQITSRM